MSSTHGVLGLVKFPNSPTIPRQPCQDVPVAIEPISGKMLDKDPKRQHNSLKRRRIDRGVRMEADLSVVPDVIIDSTAAIDFIAPLPLAFLSFPFDIITTIVGFASNETLISYSQTCHILRLCSCRIYLHRTGIIKSKDRYTRVTLSQEFPPIAIQILTSFLPMQTFGLIHLNCDFFTLRHFFWEISELIHSCNLYCLYLHYHSDERPILWDPATALALNAVLGSIQAPLPSVAILHGFRPSGAMAPYNPTSLQRRKSLQCKVDYHLRQFTFMDALRYLKLDSASFPTPALYNIYSRLLTGATLCSLDFTCDDLDLYQDFVERARFPNLQVLHITVRSSFSVYLDEQFLHRHPLLCVVWLLNNPNLVHSNGPKTVVISTTQELKLPDVRYVRIAANYSGWKMQDTSSLSTFEIQAVSPFMSARSGTFCQEVKSLCGIMVASNHLQLQEGFVLGIDFPERFATHLSLSESPMTKAFKCECAERDSTVDNVGSLKLTFEKLDNNVIRFLRRWLSWFPNLKSLQLESTEVVTHIALIDLDAFRTSCLYLNSVQHSNLGCSSCDWTFGSHNQGSWTKSL